MNPAKAQCDLPECPGHPAVCRFLEAEGRSALLGYFRKRAPWDTAEDLAHDAFIKAWSHCGDLHEPARVRPWLFGIARNHLIDHYRRSASAKARLEDAYPVFECNEPIEAEAFRGDMVELLRERLELLPEEQRPVVAALLDGERQVDIARRLRIPLSTVKSRTQRARRRILEYANEQCHLVKDSFGRVIDCEAKAPSCCA